MEASKKLKRRFVLTVVILLVTFFSLVMVTFAWYVYQTSARTSTIRMAVGTGSSLQISNAPDGPFGTAAVLDEFTGLLTPVSTNRITGGFQKVREFIDGGEGQPRRLAAFFRESEVNDYYQTTLYFRVSGGRQQVYLADIGYEDDDAENPISTAIRMGMVVHGNGSGTAAGEYIFAINTDHNPGREYNTATGQEGYVLDCTRTDGTTVPMENLYTSDNYCVYDRETGGVTLSEQSVGLFSVVGGADGGYGEAVRVDVYIWLEGCDEDCTNNLCSRMLDNIALSFACKAEQQ